MKHQILEIIRKYPKHYVIIIKKNPVLLAWVEENSIAITDNLSAKIYSAINWDAGNLVFEIR